jgi:hypothetical protein
MIPVNYPSDSESAAFDPKFNKDKKLEQSPDRDDFVEKFFNLNPDSNQEQSRKDYEIEEKTVADIDYSKVNQNIIPTQGDTFSLGTALKPWTTVFSKDYKDENGNPLPYFSTIKTNVDVKADASKATLELVSTTNSVTFLGDDAANKININTNKQAVQPKHALTIGYAAWNDYVCTAGAPQIAFNQLFIDIAASGVKNIIVQDGTYSFSGTVNIPSDCSFKLVGTKGACFFQAYPVTSFIFGTDTLPPFDLYAQTIEGIGIDVLTIKSCLNLRFINCILFRLNIGTATSTPWNISFEHCHIYGTVNILNGYQIDFRGGCCDAINGNFCNITTSSIITFAAVNVISIASAGAAFILADSGLLPTERIIVSDCHISTYFASANLISDLRSNALSTQLKMSGTLSNISINPPSYFNSGTNKFNFTP